jgi:membrane protease YdiL (CAAX protease family)
MIMRFLKSFLLVLGGAVIVGSCVFTLNHLADRVVATVLVPGFVMGLIMIVVSMRLGRDRWHWFGD